MKTVGTGVTGGTPGETYSPGSLPQSEVSFQAAGTRQQQAGGVPRAGLLWEFLSASVLGL